MNRHTGWQCCFDVVFFEEAYFAEWRKIVMSPGKKGSSSAKGADKGSGGKASTSSKGAAKTAAGGHHTTAKNVVSKTKQFAWIVPSKGAASILARPKEQKYAREHSIRYYIFNMHEEANSVGILLYGERDFQLTSWLSKVGDDVIRKKTGDFDPIPFFDATFSLHNNEQKPIQNDRGQ